MTEHVDAETLAMLREGLLAADQAAVAGAHLAACDRCRQADSQLAFVSELLATAPAPPMPPALSVRIEDALAAEAAARAAAAPAPPAPVRSSAGPAGSRAPEAAGAGPAHAADAPPLAASGSGTAPGGPGTGPGRRAGAGTGPASGRPPRRSPGGLARSRARLRAMAAAAAIVVIGGGGYAISQALTQGGTAAQSSGAAAPRPAASRLGGPAVGMEPNSTVSPGGHQLIATVSSGTNYTPRQFSSQVRTVLARHPAGSAQSSPAGGWRGFPATGIAACVNAVTHGQHPRLVDLATYRGKPAMIIVVSGSGGTPGKAWVVARDCTAAKPDIIHTFPLAP